MKTVKKITALFIALSVVLSSSLPVFAVNSSAKIQPPKSISLIRTKKQNVKISWGKVSGATGYYLYRADGKSGFSKIATVKKKSYTDKNVGKSKAYKYKVAAYKITKSGTITSGFTKTVSLAPANVFSSKLVNQTKLIPMLTGHIDVDNKAKEILSKIITDNMTNYQKLVAIYDYCTFTFTYSRRPKYYITSKKYAKKLYENSVAMDIYYLDRAMTAFTTNKGACTAYSGAFVVLCDLAGFSAYIDEGQIHSKSGGYTDHTWTRVYFGGTYFIFDPQVEQSNLNSKNNAYTYFGQLPTEKRYIKDKNTLKRSIQLRTAAEKVFCGKDAKSIEK